VHGIYYTSLSKYLKRYPCVRKEHFHDFYSILLFNRGHSFIRINNNSFEVNPGTICLVAPNQLHSFEEFRDVGGTAILFCQDFYVEEFSFVRLLNIFSYTSSINGHINNPCISLSDSDFESITSLSRSIETEYEKYTPSNNSSPIIRSLLNVLLLKFAGLYGEKTDRKVNGEHSLIHELSRMVDFHFVNEHQIGFYTSAFNISEKQLNDICNRHFSCGLKKILTDRLMQEARKLLMSSGMTVAEISYKLHFDDNSYFNKVFKRQIGLTPKRFREIHRKLVP